MFQAKKNQKKMFTKSGFIFLNKCSKSNRNKLVLLKDLEISKRRGHQNGRPMIKI